MQPRKFLRFLSMINNSATVLANVAVVEFTIVVFTVVFTGGGVLESASIVISENAITQVKQ